MAGSGPLVQGERASNGDQPLAMYPRPLLRFLVLAALLPVASPLARAAPPVAAVCFADWSEAATVVAREQLIPAKGVHELAQRHVAGAHLLHITLCREPSRYVYRLVVRDAAGRVSQHTVDARDPFAPW
jgi:hypothetical protein